MERMDFGMQWICGGLEMGSQALALAVYRDSTWVLADLSWYDFTVE